MNTPSINHLFVYGSLRSGFRNPAYGYLTQNFHLLGEAIVKGMLYDKGDFPVAKPFIDDHFINGELYALKNPDEFAWVFGQLDDYEGMNTEEGIPPAYIRKETIAYMDGKPIEAWIYWYNGDTSHMKPIETGDVMKYLQQKNKP